MSTRWHGSFPSEMLPDHSFVFLVLRSHSGQIRSLYFPMHILKIQERLDGLDFDQDVNFENLLLN